MKKSVWLVLGVVTALGISSTKAEATLILAGNINGTLFCATDNNVACGYGTQLTDNDLTAGILELGTNTTLIPGLSVGGSTHFSVFGPPDNVLDSGSVAIQNNTGATVNGTVAIGQTDYVGPSSTFDLSGSGTWLSSAGSSIHMEWWNDPENQQGGETETDTPGNLIDEFDYLATDASGTESFEHNNDGALLFPDFGPYSMTLRFDVQILNGDRLSSRGQNITKPVVPEPATMTLLGMGLLGVATRAARARKRSKV